MTYIPNSEQDQQEMLQAIGIESIGELFAPIPDNLQLNRPLALPPALSELELTGRLQQLADRNAHAQSHAVFLGGGSYDHFVPAVVDAIASRGEFYTSYTPYQPEVSQGNLQATFEYQSLMCALTGMDVSNASLYDGGSATVEAVLLSMNATRRSKVVALGGVHPEYLRTLQTYLANLDCQLVTIEPADGQVDLAAVADQLDDQTACVLVQHPNFFGCLEQVGEIGGRAHQAGALLIQVFDPLSLGLLKRPAELGADIAVAEGQCLGIPMQFGGPYLGIMACKEPFVRRLPGRIAGQTVDRRGRRCWVLTLQTREQHIRRDKATSNICTNQGLMALRATVYLSWLGPHGLADVAQLCLQKSHAAARQLTASDRFELAWTAPFFKEFVVRDRQRQVPQLIDRAAAAGVLAGVPLGRWYPELDDCLLVAVTEKRTADQINRWSQLLTESSPTESTIHA